MAALAPVLPELGAAMGAAQGEAAGWELLEAVAAHLTAAAQRRPHLLVFDDLHAADAGSLRLLELVVRSLRGQQLMVLGSYRDVEARLAPEGARLLGRIAREGQLLPLARLAAGETAALAQARLGRALPAAIADELQRTTEGNPLFVGETIELLAARGELERPAAHPPPIPSGVEDVIRGRLARLSAPARRALQIASVLGREHDARVAHDLIASHGIGNAEAALAEAEALGFIARAATDRLRLSHAIVRDAIYASLAVAERRSLHLAASRLYDAAGAGVEAAHHALAALPEGDAGHAVALAGRAADESARRLAFEVAAEMYGRALAALPVVPANPSLRCDLLVALARALLSSGALEQARARALEAAALARAAADGKRLAAAALAFGSEIRIGVVDPSAGRIAGGGDLGVTRRRQGAAADRHGAPGGGAPALATSRRSRCGWHARRSRRPAPAATTCWCRRCTPVWRRWSTTRRPRSGCRWRPSSPRWLRRGAIARSPCTRGRARSTIASSWATSRAPIASWRSSTRWRTTSGIRVTCGGLC